MVNEIFIREETDPYYVDGVLETGNTTENIISKIRMFLGTVPGDVLGDDNFGIDIEYLVFNTKQSAKEIEKQINEKLLSYLGNIGNVSVDVNVSFGQDVNRGSDYAVIDFSLNGVKSIGILVDQ